jgi:hypothetical protein
MKAVLIIRTAGVNYLAGCSKAFGLNCEVKIINNDTRKFQACLEQGVELCIIDSSKQKRFTEQSSKQYLDIITQIINIKLTG